MSVVISGVERRTPAAVARIKASDVLVSINGNDIMDVLDYRFYQNEKELDIVYLRNGKSVLVRVCKDEYEELGLLFDTYLMDEQRSCKNKCIFCFIDQMPPGMRDSLYFKDDDSRLSFLFGNYITLTNITEHEIERIIKMHISPINISVHTTDPALRVKMMNNRFSGDALSVISRFNDAGIKMNFQLVLCPGINDGEQLKKSLEDLTALESLQCLGVVPVGVTKYRDGLFPLTLFDKHSASDVIDCINIYGSKCKADSGSRKVYAADEFYLLAEREIPEAEHYEDFSLLENGIGLLSLFRSEVLEVLEKFDPPSEKRKISIATGCAAHGFLSNLVDTVQKKWHNLDCTVYKIDNDFFGRTITVAGLLTGQDILLQMKGRDMGEKLYIPSAMLRAEGDLFLDDMTPKQLSDGLGVPVDTAGNDGYEFLKALAGLPSVTR